MRRRLAVHAALAVLGLLGVVWALTWGAHPVIMCRDVVMQPNEVCANASGTRTQTYQQRWDAAQSARPVVAGVGVAAAAFAVALFRADLRAAQAGDKGIGP